MIQGSVHQEDIIIINIHPSNITASKYTKKILVKYNNNRGLQYPTFNNGEITRRKINKKTLDLNH